MYTPPTNSAIDTVSYLINRSALSNAQTTMGLLSIRNIQISTYYLNLPKSMKDVISDIGAGVGKVLICCSNLHNNPSVLSGVSFTLQ